MEIIYAEMPYFESIKEVIDYFAKKAKTAEEAHVGAVKYVKDRFFHTEQGTKVNLTEEFKEAIFKRFAKIHRN
ncbi:MAG: hypothetical protein ABIG40_01730 [Parcubacteria group bacterium]